MKTNTDVSVLGASYLYPVEVEMVVLDFLGSLRSLHEDRVSGQADVDRHLKEQEHPSVQAGASGAAI